MNAGLLAGAVAILVAALLTPPTRRFAIAIGAVDAPGGRRVHTNLVPRLGGVAIVAAYLMAVAACLATGVLRGAIFDWKALWAFLGGGVIIAVTGAADDIRAIGAKKKLAAQCLVATLAWFGGARVEPIIFIPGLGPVDVGLTFSYLATLVWIVAFINAINLVDGLDGLAGGVVFFATATNLVVALVSGNTLAAALNAALGGAVLGFLFYNFNPATIFMGDTGSMFLGYALGTAALMSGRQKESTLVSLLVPVIALGVPFTDTLLAMVRRVVARRSVFAADRQHLHHRLMDLGLTHKRAVLTLYGCSILLCLAAVAAALGRDWEIGAAIAGAVVTLIGIVRFAGYFELALMKRQGRNELFSGGTDILRRGLPSLILGTESVSTASEVWAALERLLEAGEFAYAEYCPEGENALWRWERKESGGRMEGKLVETAFPVRVFPGSNEGTLRFGCTVAAAHLPPQLEVLLQIVVDSVEAALVRMNLRAPGAMIRAVSAAGE